ncbi:MAG: iron-containing alcohol dehydrogenase [Ignavibacteriales bacterium]|nr:iron-containing alcohol dehydrogenase [Ignavibacteriales bacterium]
MADYVFARGRLLELCQENNIKTETFNSYRDILEFLKMIRNCQQQISIPSILKIGENELNNLGLYLQDATFKNIACFFSYGIEEIYGEQIFESFKKAGLNILHKDSIDEINLENVIHTAFKIPKAVDVLIGIGGGKALDYSKYCASCAGFAFYKRSYFHF